MRLLRLARNPKAAPAAIVRRVVPNSRTFGFPFVKVPDGSITFRERGFVAAPSPSMLLARHNYELGRIHRELDDLSATRSLEFGCGFGRLSMAFASHSQEHIAVDINAEALEIAQATYPSIDFRLVGPNRLPFPDDYFDLAVTWTVLQHVRPEHIGSVAQEIRRVLSPGGTLLICEETRDPAGSGGHTWHRTVATYEEILAPLSLVRHGLIDEIAALPGMESPGDVMVFRDTSTTGGVR